MAHKSSSGNNSALQPEIVPLVNMPTAAAIAGRMTETRISSTKDRVKVSALRFASVRLLMGFRPATGWRSHGGRDGPRGGTGANEVRHRGVDRTHAVAAAPCRVPRGTRQASRPLLVITSARSVFPIRPSPPLPTSTAFRDTRPIRVGVARPRRPFPDSAASFVSVREVPHRNRLCGGTGPSVWRRTPAAQFSGSGHCSIRTACGLPRRGSHSPH